MAALKRVLKRKSPPSSERADTPVEWVEHFKGARAWRARMDKVEADDGEGGDDVDDGAEEHVVELPGRRGDEVPLLVFDDTIDVDAGGLSKGRVAASSNKVSAFPGFQLAFIAIEVHIAQENEPCFQ